MKKIKIALFLIMITQLLINDLKAQDLDITKVPPDQDFTENSDLHWSKSISEIDLQLYKKYHLSAEELAFIESMIKPLG